MSEFDSTSAVQNSHAKKLAALMETGAEHGRLWRADELQAIFRHQMSAPIAVDLGGFDPRTAAKLKTLSEAHGLVLKSFGDLFEHPAPPHELVELVKAFAKANMDHPESSLPTEIATALYYSSIAAAWVRLGERISTLPDADLKRGFQWAESQTWLDEKTKSLLAEALRKFSEAAKGTAS